MRSASFQRPAQFPACAHVECDDDDDDDDDDGMGFQGRAW